LTCGFTDFRELENLPEKKDEVNEICMKATDLFSNSSKDVVSLVIFVHPTPFIEWFKEYKKCLDKD
jgi:hypothetical protein